MNQYGELSGSVQLELIPPPDDRTWWELFCTRPARFRVVKEFTFIDPNGTHWPCRKDSITNGLSIPWLVRWLVPHVTARGMMGAVVHDVGEPVRYDAEGQPVDLGEYAKSATTCAQVLWQALRHDNTHPARAWCARFVTSKWDPRF